MTLSRKDVSGVYFDNVTSDIENKAVTQHLKDAIWRLFTTSIITTDAFKAVLKIEKFL